MDMYDKYIQKKKNQIHFAEHLQRMHQELWAFSDLELGLANSTGFFNAGYIVFDHKRQDTALSSDPAFQKLETTHDSLRKAGCYFFRTINILYELEHLGTQMVNRTMGKETYKRILNGQMNCLYEAKEIIEMKRHEPR